MIDKQRLVRRFLELVRIDSISKSEARVAGRLQEELKSLGLHVELDHAAQKVGSNTGNVIATLEGNVKRIPPLLLCAHMDTVGPGEGIEPIIDGEIIKTDGRTILGGDDKSGIAVICEVLELIKERRLPHGDIEVVLTVCEELGMLGAKHLDYSRLRSTFGFVFDSLRLDELIVKAPAADSLQFRIHGMASHAGVSPERGISAIHVAARAIAMMKLGRLDGETTANIGVIHGGVATNVVPEWAVIEGEARSHDEAKLRAQTAHMRQCVADAVLESRIMLDGQAHSATVEENIYRDFPPMNVPDDSRVVRLIKMAAHATGLNIQSTTLGGGFDANVFNANGIEMISIGSGMRDIHTTEESLHIDEMCGAAELLLEAITLTTNVDAWEHRAVT